MRNIISFTSFWFLSRERHLIVKELHGTPPVSEHLTPPGRHLTSAAFLALSVTTQSLWQWARTPNSQEHIVLSHYFSFVLDCWRRTKGPIKELIVCLDIWIIENNLYCEWPTLLNNWMSGQQPNWPHSLPCYRVFVLLHSSWILHCTHLCSRPISWKPPYTKYMCLHQWIHCPISVICIIRRRCSAHAVWHLGCRPGIYIFRWCCYL